MDPRHGLPVASVVADALEGPLDTGRYRALRHIASRHQTRNSCASDGLVKVWIGVAN